MTDHDDTPTDSTGPSRRRVAQAAGWSVPLVIAAVGAPAAQASTTPPAFDGLVGVWSTPEKLVSGITRAFFTITNTSQTTVDLGQVMFYVTEVNQARYLIAGSRGAVSISTSAPGSEGGEYAAVVLNVGSFPPGASRQYECFANASFLPSTVRAIPTLSPRDTPYNFPTAAFPL